MLHGLELLKTMAEGLVADPSFTDTVTVLDMIAEGDKVTVLAKHPDGREQLTLYALANGKVVQDRPFMGPEVPK